MMLKDVRDYIAALGIAEDSHCYCGKMADKKDKSIGVYPFLCIGTEVRQKRSRQQQPCRRLLYPAERNRSTDIRSNL